MWVAFVCLSFTLMLSCSLSVAINKKFTLQRHLKLLVYSWLSMYDFTTTGSSGVIKELGTNSQGNIILLALPHKDQKEAGMLIHFFHHLHT